TRLSEGEADDGLLAEAKARGFSNQLISGMTKINMVALKKQLEKAHLKPAYLQIDGSAGTVQPQVHAYYSAFGVQDESVGLAANSKKVLVIGMLPLQVSVTNEFDYMISHALDTLHNNNYATVLLSNNDESVATSYRRADKVYFEPIT
ncbi:carbamoyl phosphate synthase large subunit, partial [Lactobacillus sp. XV13L]|nr:carbamoyl phosphate synthase large subunit [Lactobacillus sp. XV13L]